MDAALEKRQVKRAYKLYDERGLFLLVTPTADTSLSCLYSNSFCMRAAPAARVACYVRCAGSRPPVMPGLSCTLWMSRAERVEAQADRSHGA